MRGFDAGRRSLESLQVVGSTPGTWWTGSPSPRSAADFFRGNAGCVAGGLLI